MRILRPNIHRLMGCLYSIIALPLLPRVTRPPYPLNRNLYKVADVATTVSMRTNNMCKQCVWLDATNPMAQRIEMTNPKPMMYSYIDASSANVHQNGRVSLFSSLSGLKQKESHAPSVVSALVMIAKYVVIHCRCVV